MRLELDEYEKDTLVETIQYRIENDEHLLTNASIKDDLEDLIDKFIEDTLLLLENFFQNLWVQKI